MILWDIMSNFIRGTFAKKSKMATKSKMAATSSKLCLLCDFLKDTNITEQDNHIKHHGMFIDVIVVHFKLILMNILAYPSVMCHRNTHFTFFAKECTCTVALKPLRKTM